MGGGWRYHFVWSGSMVTVMLAGLLASVDFSRPLETSKHARVDWNFLFPELIAITIQSLGNSEDNSQEPGVYGTSPLPVDTVPTLLVLCPTNDPMMGDREHLRTLTLEVCRCFISNLWKPSRSPECCNDQRADEFTPPYILPRFSIPGFLPGFAASCAYQQIVLPAPYALHGFLESVVSAGNPVS